MKGQSRVSGAAAFANAGAALASVRRAPSATSAARVTVPAKSGAVAPPPRRGERRLGAPLTVSQIGRIAAQAPAGVVLSRTAPGPELEEGLNTLIVSIAPPSGARVEASCTFFVEAPAVKPAKPKPGESRLPRKTPRNLADLTPQKIAGKFTLSQKKDRLKIVAAQKKTIMDRGTAKRAVLIAILPPSVKLKSVDRLPPVRRPER
jgi:hypothetical protein